MKQYSYEYRFFQDGAAVKLLVSAGRTARVTAIVGGRVYRGHWFENVVTGGSIGIPGAVFSPRGIDCDLTLDGLRVRINAEFAASARFAAPIGAMSACGLSAYQLSAPVVFGAMSGSAEFGRMRFCERAVVSVDSAIGSISEFRHSVVWGARDGNVFWMAAGENRTLWKPWRYAAAYVGTPRHVYELKGPTRLTEFCENGSGMLWTLANPALRLDVRLTVHHETADSLGYRYATDCTAELTLTAAGRMSLFEQSMPASLTHLGMVRVKMPENVAETAAERTEAKALSGTE